MQTRAEVEFGLSIFLLIGFFSFFQTTLVVAYDIRREVVSVACFLHRMSTMCGRAFLSFDLNWSIYSPVTPPPEGISCVQNLNDAVIMHQFRDVDYP